MKTIILSDLNWEHHLRSVSVREVNSINIERIKISRYRSIQHYIDIIISEKADLVLIAGDVTGDGSCGHGFYNAFLLLLSLLDQQGISTCFISGNHDEPNYYRTVENGILTFSNIHEISNQVINIGGIKILGIPYETTYSKSKIKNLLLKFDGQYDIVLAHSQLKRRIRLFELNTKYIATGHFDRKLFSYQDTVFISLDNDTSEISYATIDLNLDKIESVAYHVLSENGSRISITEQKENITTEKQDGIVKINDHSIGIHHLENEPNFKLANEPNDDLDFLRYIRGIQYLNVLKKLNEVKDNPELKPTLTVTKSIINKQITSTYRVSTSLIVDFLGKRSR